MTPEKKELIYKAIRENNLFNYLAEDGWHLGHDDLVILSKEIAFAYEGSVCGNQQDADCESIIANLESYWGA